jgi:hypothetical protein
MSKLTFENLTKYQKTMLKVRATKIYCDKPVDAPMAVVEATFEIIHSLGYDIVRNESRESNPQEPKKTPENPKDQSGYWSKK